MADKMIRCPEGHFYDPSKHNACPWCALPSDSGGSAQKTRPVSPGAIPDSAPPPPDVSVPETGGTDPRARGSTWSGVRRKPCRIFLTAVKKSYAPAGMTVGATRS